VIAVCPDNPGELWEMSSSSKAPRRTINVSSDVVVTAGLDGDDVELLPPFVNANTSMGLSELCPVNRMIQP
jgi:hypothetical protein